MIVANTESLSVSLEAGFCFQAKLTKQFCFFSLVAIADMDGHSIYKWKIKSYPFKPHNNSGFIYSPYFLLLLLFCHGARSL